MAIDLNKIKQQYQELSKPKGQTNEEFLNQFIKLEDGDNIVRILPPKEEGGEFFVATAIHRIEGGKQWRCRKVTHNEQCPICDLYFSLWKRHNDTAGKGAESFFSKEARKIKPNKRYFMNALDRRTSEVKVLSVGSKVFEKVLQSMVDPDEPLGDVTDPKTGYDLKIVKVPIKNQPWPDYSNTKFRAKPSLLGTPAEVASYMEQAFDLSKFVSLEDYDEMKTFADQLSVKLFSSPTESKSTNEGDSQESFMNRLKTGDNE